MQTFFHLRKKSTRKSRVEKSSREHTTDFNRRESCFFQKNVSSFRKRAHVFSLEKEEHTKESRVEKSSRTHTDRFCFLRRAAETKERAVEKEQSFFTRESAHKEKSKSLLVNTRQTDFDREGVASFKKMSSFLSFLQI